jgi:hypothetical protein
MKTNLFYGLVAFFVTIIFLNVNVSNVRAAETPQIIITNVPRIGTAGNAEGRVVWGELSTSNCGEYAVIAMLLGAYVKPTYDNYLNAIDAQGKFSINITSDVNDYTVENVTFYFVLRSTFNGILGESVNESYMNGKYCMFH